MQIIFWSEADVLARIEELSALLRDAVEHGASMGFMLPLAETELRDYWRGVAAQVAGGAKIVLAAGDESGRLVGSAQLGLELRPNGRHRAEVQKVMVLHAARGRGVGGALMQRLEDEARLRGRTLLFLDTSVGRSGAVEFYTQRGYTLCGGIPDYARDPDGTFAANAIFFKRL
ncbi:MAG: GNAT family N-acetyltransferase [Opitutus sp.]|nr:GNAT family N-acetyltransferase [Opitutus sp.]